MKKLTIAIFGICIVLASCKNNQSKEDKSIAKNIETSQKNAIISPISHATAVIEFGKETIYLDPTGGKSAFEGYNSPTYVFITDVHGDHMNLKTLDQLDLSKSIVVAPKAVSKRLKELQIKELVELNNGEMKKFSTFSVEAIPMYNLRKEALKFHQKGRGNGYIFTINDERIYFSGDTEDIPEMRALKNIDRAFVCMNLPYTMTVESAASAVLDFKPKQVYPYHYRGTGGLSDVGKFKSIVNKGNPAIQVVQLNWYPKK